MVNGDGWQDGWLVRALCKLFGPIGWLNANQNDREGKAVKRCARLAGLKGYTSRSRSQTRIQDYLAWTEVAGCTAQISHTPVLSAFPVPPISCDQAPAAPQSLTLPASTYARLRSQDMLLEDLKQQRSGEAGGSSGRSDLAWELWPEAWDTAVAVDSKTTITTAYDRNLHTGEAVNVVGSRQLVPNVGLAVEYCTRNHSSAVPLTSPCTPVSEASPEEPLPPATLGTDSTGPPSTTAPAPAPAPAPSVLDPSPGSAPPSSVSTVPIRAPSIGSPILPSASGTSQQAPQALSPSDPSTSAPAPLYLRPLGPVSAVSLSQSPSPHGQGGPALPLSPARRRSASDLPSPPPPSPPPSPSPAHLPTASLPSPPATPSQGPPAAPLFEENLVVSGAITPRTGAKACASAGTDGHAKAELEGTTDWTGLKLSQLCTVDLRKRSGSVRVSAAMGPTENPRVKTSWRSNLHDKHSISMDVKHDPSPNVSVLGRLSSNFQTEQKVGLEMKGTLSEELEVDIRLNLGKAQQPSLCIKASNQKRAAANEDGKPTQDSVPRRRHTWESTGEFRRRSKDAVVWWAQWRNKSKGGCEAVVKLRIESGPPSDALLLVDFLTPEQ